MPAVLTLCSLIWKPLARVWVEMALMVRARVDLSHVFFIVRATPVLNGAQTTKISSSLVVWQFVLYFGFLERKCSYLGIYCWEIDSDYSVI
ncbi:hypothetical protein D3C77_725350 [compost metagenome]